MLPAQPCPVFPLLDAQILAMSFFLLAFAVAGFLSPANQGSLLTTFVVLFMTMGSFAGYFSARLYKMCVAPCYLSTIQESGLSRVISSSSPS